MMEGLLSIAIVNITLQALAACFLCVLFVMFVLFLPLICVDTIKAVIKKDVIKKITKRGVK